MEDRETRLAALDARPDARKLWWQSLVIVVAVNGAAAYVVLVAVITGTLEPIGYAVLPAALGVPAAWVVWQTRRMARRRDRSRPTGAGPQPDDGGSAA